uniref:DUF834 domain-containing protein n=1 Tax=Oryza punctata TaxID=4537 RepID=A0A0E0KNA8_ORYPU
MAKLRRRLADGGGGGARIGGDEDLVAGFDGGEAVAGLALALAMPKEVAALGGVSRGGDTARPELAAVWKIWREVHDLELKTRAIQGAIASLRSLRTGIG